MTRKLPSKQPTKDYPPELLLPVFPPTQPFPNKMLVFSNKQILVNSYPSSLMCLGLMLNLTVADILENKGILKHSEASLAISKAVLIFPSEP